MVTANHFKLPDGTIADLDIGDPFAYLENKYPNGGAGLHNSIYRGENLGSAPTDEQYTNIKNGTFKGIWLGDYWKGDDNIVYRNMGANTIDGTGDRSTPPNSITIMPDTCSIARVNNDSKYMMDTDEIPSNGYVGTKMFTDTLPNKVLPILTAKFGSHILKHKELLVSSASNGVANGWAWSDVQVNIPNFIMIFGVQSYVVPSDSAGYQIANRNVQLPAFRANPELIKSNSAYWLSDIASTNSFGTVGDNGISGRSNASNSWSGVRPYALITG